ncbi:Uncharacterised protein [Bacteroides thetaiotaomicron]|uniref:Uncharacterized protein n=1 Tax=Bacteroides thetaiotaomicron TaxID=818 RepID=A0A174VQN1_BACT4|nr:Uncharacterised protein [Bacteroides thetaiotaomicron]
MSNVFITFIFNIFVKQEEGATEDTLINKTEI